MTIKYVYLSFCFLFITQTRYKYSKLRELLCHQLHQLFYFVPQNIFFTFDAASLELAELKLL